MTVTVIGYAVRMGEVIALNGGYRLIDSIT